MKSILIFLIFCFFSSINSYDMKKSDKLHEHNEHNDKVLNIQKENEINWIEYFDISKCELVSKCQSCTFKELQKWPEC